jgi:hypothetical protein
MKILIDPINEITLRERIAQREKRRRLAPGTQVDTAGISHIRVGRKPDKHNSHCNETVMETTLFGKSGNQFWNIWHIRKMLSAS